MLEVKYSPKEICRRGEEIYESHLRAQLENGDNIGKILVIDIETGEYEMGEDRLSAVHQLKAKRPGSIRYAKRIGSPFFYKLH